MYYKLSAYFASLFHPIVFRSCHAPHRTAFTFIILLISEAEKLVAQEAMLKQNVSLDVSRGK